MNLENPKHPILVGLSLIGGLGLTLMAVALAVGVIQGAAANSGLMGGLFWTGLVMLVGATAGWFGASQPFKHIDDINQPHYTGHHHEEH